MPEIIPSGQIAADDAENPRVAFRPYVSPQTILAEFTPRALIFGTLLGILFGASSLYLVLKVGITVSASIPVAVISLTLFRLWSRIGGRDATILENNIVQTAGSGGESIAFGLGVTMPAIMILMMIPLRRALIVAQHGQLKYPEGTACAEVLKAGAAALDPKARAGALTGKAIFTGLGIGLVYKALMSALKLWKDTPEKVFGPPLKGGSLSAEISPELLGVGYIIGPRTASIMMAGGVLSALVLTPLIKFFGEGLGGALAPGGKPIADMSPGQIRRSSLVPMSRAAP